MTTDVLLETTGGRRNRSRWLVPLAVALAAAAVALMIAGGSETAPARDAAHPPLEGIGVRGHWTITVMDGDAEVDTYTFDNHLERGGATLLRELLAGDRVGSNRWQISTDGGSFSGGCGQYGNEGCAAEATVEQVYEDNSWRTRLTADIQYELDGTIARVATETVACTRDVGFPCDGWAAWSRFTRHTLSSSIRMTGGQWAHIVVDISFTTA